MSLADVVAQRPPAVAGCKVVKLLAGLPDRDRQAFDELLASHETNPTIIALVKEAERITLPDTALRRHRRGVCTCGPR